MQSLDETLQHIGQELVALVNEYLAAGVPSVNFYVINFQLECLFTDYK